MAESSVPELTDRVQRSVRRSVDRLRLTAICLAITLVTFAQRSGTPAGDTKLDLVVTPWRFLRNGVGMWDPLGSGGQMQDQAYGYLFPMGPAFLLGHAVELPAWVVQRGWESALLVAAFLGVVRLARQLGVRGFWPRVGAGICYALAPRMLFEVGVISAELMPVVALPWVLLPLVRVANHGGSPRRAAAVSGLALLLAGGVNAAATLAILPAPALWILTRTGALRRRLAAWWALAVLLACAWWIAPLLVLGRYSPPFLDWIESSATTTGQTSLVQVLRGIPHWQPFLGPQEWPAGWMFVAAPAVIVATAALAALGLIGLTRAPARYRSFLVLTLLVGLVLVTAGHAASVGPPFAAQLRDLLDGVGSAFRNVHKFEPLVRLPIAIGAGHALAALGGWVVRRPQFRVRRDDAPMPTRPLVVASVLAVVAVAIAPALDGKLVAKTRSFVEPTWWTATGHWLGRHAEDGRALVVPGAAVPVFTWGKPSDDPLQPVAGAPWAVRDGVPFGQPGFVRLLDAVGASLASGQPDLALTDLLARAGVRYLVVRNDLDTAASGATPLRYVHAAVDGNPALRQVAQFGPDTGAGAPAGQLADLGLTHPRPAVQIYENTEWHGMVGLVDADHAVHANGSADSLPALVDAGLTASTPVIFDGGRTRGGATVLTDGIRRREFGFGSIGNYTTTLTRAQPYRLARAAHDYLPAGAGPLTVASYSGIAGVRAASSADDVGALFYRGAQYSPWAALDGDVDTAWVSAAGDGAVGQWLEVDLGEARTFAGLGIAFAPDVGPYPTRLRVTTDAGSRDVAVLPTSEPQAVRVPPGPTRSVRLTVLATAQPSGPAAQVGVTALSLPGVAPGRALAVAGPLDPDAVVFSVAPGYRPACLTVFTAAACDSSWGAAGDEDGDLSRRFTLDPGGKFTLAARVRLQPGAALDELLDAGNLLSARVSTRNSADPRERPGAAVDGDPDTGWVAAAGDPTPTITVSLLARRSVSGVRLAPMRGAPVAAPTTVRVEAGGTVVTTALGPGGVVRFPQPVHTARVRITVLATDLRASTDTVTGGSRILPVGIAEVTLLGSAVFGSSQGTVTVPCGQLPEIVLDGAPVELRATASSADLLAGRPIPATPCDSAVLGLGPGPHTVTQRANAAATPVSLTLVRSGATPFAAPRASPGSARIDDWGRTTRTVDVHTAAAAILVVRENVNGGWRATLDGAALTPVTVDGWEQGWMVPAGADGTVRLEYAPQPVVDAGFVGGAAAVLLLVVLALVRRRRTSAAAGHWSWGGRTSAVVALAALGMLGGVAGVGVALALVIARRFVALPGVLAGGLLLAGGLVNAAGPAGSAHRWDNGALAQLLCLAAVGVVVLRVRGARR